MRAECNAQKVEGGAVKAWRRHPFGSPASPPILARVSHIDSYYQVLFCSLLSILPSISQLMLGSLTHRLDLL